MITRRLHPTDDAAIEELLLTDVTPNLFLLSMLARPVLDGLWVGAAHQDTGRLEAVSLTVGHLTVPYAVRPTAIADVGEYLREMTSPGLVIGPRETCDVLLSKWVEGAPHVQLNQRLYTIESIKPKQSHVEFATLNDLELLCQFSLQMQEEDLGNAPVNIDAHRAAVRSRILEERAWILKVDGEVVFTVNVGSKGPFGCQLGGTYVPNKFRGMGYAKQGIHGVVQTLLQSLPRVTLHVRENNTVAIRVYESVGFTRSHPFRVAIMAKNDTP